MDLGNLRFFLLLRYKNSMTTCFIDLSNPHQLLLLLFFPSSFLFFVCFLFYCYFPLHLCFLFFICLYLISFPVMLSSLKPLWLKMVGLHKVLKVSKAFRVRHIVVDSIRFLINTAAVKKPKGFMSTDGSYSKHHSVGMGGGSFAFAGSIASFCLALLKAYCERTNAAQLFVLWSLTDRIKNVLSVVLPLPGPSRILPLLRCSLHS